MDSHPAKQLSTVAINALWCLLIALALLAFPIIARQARLQTADTPQRTPATPASTEMKAQTPTGTILVTHSEKPAAPH